MRICLSLVTGTGCGVHNADDAHFCRNCGSPLRNALKLRNAGEQVGGYTIEALVGHGGYGAVYRARGVIDGREQVVALKEALEPAAAEISAMRSEFATRAGA
jgi:ribosomal protein L40E